jgi:hypothetical protein
VGLQVQGADLDGGIGGVEGVVRNRMEVTKLLNHTHTSVLLTLSYTVERDNVTIYRPIWIGVLCCILIIVLLACVINGMGSLT